MILGVRPVVAEATVRCLKSARGEIAATARTNSPSPALLAKLSSDGRVAFEVRGSDAQGERVGEADFSWHVQARG